MNATTDKLAAALRAILNKRESIGEDMDFADSLIPILPDAREALAEYDARRVPDRMAPVPHNLTAREWIERARETLDKRTHAKDDDELIDAHDDLCNALEVMGT